MTLITSFCLLSIHRAQWGFHPGGWGKPPVDEYNRPIYGDVFGVAAPVESELAIAADRELWGELEPEEEDEEEDESEEEEEAEELFPSHPPADGLETPSGTQSIVSTVPGGLETPEFLDIRKDRELGTESVESSVAGGPTAPKQLYQVIEERAVDVRGFMGSAIGYDVHGSGQQGPRVLGQEDRGVKVRRCVVYSILTAALPGYHADRRSSFPTFFTSSAKPVRSTCRSTQRSLPSCRRRTSPPDTRPTAQHPARSEASKKRTSRIWSPRRAASVRRAVRAGRTRRRAGEATTRKSSSSKRALVDEIFMALLVTRTSRLSGSPS